MGKEKGWFGCCVKRVFTPEAKLEQGDKKSGRRGRWLCGRIRIKHHCHSAVVVDEEPAAVALPPERRRMMLNDAKEEQRKYALAVAVAMAAAAEAAIAAANAAAHVVRLTGLPSITRVSAATKIQSAYRAHLARKALMALKGVVRLQAVIRGQIVRGQMNKRLVIKSLQCSVAKKTHPRVHQIKLPGFSEGCRQPEEDRHEFLSSSKDLDMEQVYVNRNNTRAHMKRYAFSHRERRNDQILEELITIKNNENDKNRRKDHYERRRNVPIQHPGELNLPRRSCCGARGQDYLTGTDDASLPNSPVFPAYMAATESAKAKARSMSTPRQRLALMDLYSVHASVSAYKPKHSSWSSSNAEFAADYQ